MNFVFYSLFNTVLVLLLSPLFMGLIKKCKAFVQGRRGPPLLQAYYNIAKLLKKETVYSTSSSGIMRLTPYVNIIALLVASLFVPLAFVPQPVFGIGNIILFLYLLALARFFMALAGLDAGSTFGGMGSSREMTLSAIIEPITIIVFTALAFVLNTTNLVDMFRETTGVSIVFLNPALIPLALALFIILIVETARVPVDNPETHLELTMVHEAMILEQSGKNLALMEVTHAIKQTLFMAILINIFLPWGITTQAGVIALIVAAVSFALKGIVLSVIIALFESSFAKLRFFRLPSLFMIAFFLSLLTTLIEVFA